MSDEPFRLPGCTRARVNFRFDGRSLTGREGDTLAAALLANGIHFVARSFKYHRPRGIVAAGAEEPNAIVAVGAGARLDTNSQATRIVLREGLRATSLNAWPSLRWDVAALLGAFGRFLPAGFYYKTFFRPSWHFFEPPIRRAAGLGVAPTVPDADRYEHAHRHSDVLVVGGGPAGIAAAISAARTGVDVLLIEQDTELGGALLWEDRTIDGVPAARWAQERTDELAAMANVTILSRTVVAAYHDHNLLLAVEAPAAGGTHQRLWHVRAHRVVLATGAIERPLVFPGNDRPGIMLAAAVRQYFARYQVAAGANVVVATNNDDAYRTVRALVAAGVRVAAIVDSRRQAAADAAGIPVHRGAVIAGTRGRARVRSVTIRTFDGSNTTRVACDLVAMSGGWSPAVQLFSQSGGSIVYDAGIAAFVPKLAGQQVQAAGAAAGRLALDACLRDGFSAGAEEHIADPPWRSDEAESVAITPLWRVPAAIAEPIKQWVDFHNDVTEADVALAARENFHSVEHLKRYTTLGMAPDQGKTANVNGLAILGEETGRSPGEVGTTTFRPPYAPISFGVIGGRNRGALFHAMRHLPTHRAQAALGALMDDYGTWRRPACYPRPGEDMAAAIAREVGAVRRAVGMIDYSPLGKIEVAGPDAVRFLDRVVAARLDGLQPGQARYSLTLTETGIISDDGVISRLADGSLLMGTTSGAADRIYRLFEEWGQCELRDLEVRITDVTGQWGVILVSGPQARTLLSRLDTDIDLADDALPHMALREGILAGVPARIHRVSFTGELSFEVAVPSGYAAALWDRLAALGGDIGLTPFGLEALDVLRLEKGFIHVGGDTDGTTIPADVDLGGMIRRKTGDFRGKRSLALPALNGPRRLQLVGVRPCDSDTPLAPGSQFVLPAGHGALQSGEGHVTSSARSPTLERPIALGLLADGRARLGERLDVWHERVRRPVEIVPARSYDPQGERIRG